MVQDFVQCMYVFEFIVSKQKIFAQHPICRNMYLQPCVLERNFMLSNICYFEYLQACFLSESVLHL